MGDSNKGPSTRSLIADAEKLRGDKKLGKKKTRQLVAESEQLIGRESSARPSALRGVLIALLFVIALAGAGYLIWTLVL